MKKGDIITLNDIHMLSPGDGVKWAEKEQLIGKKLKQDVVKNEIIYTDYVCEDGENV